MSIRSVQLTLCSSALHLHFVNASVCNVILEDVPDIVNRLESDAVRNDELDVAKPFVATVDP